MQTFEMGYSVGFEAGRVERDVLAALLERYVFTRRQIPPASATECFELLRDVERVLKTLDERT